MSQYPQLSQPDFYKISSEILQWWKENEIFEESIFSREGNETFTFYEGPPSANGTPGIHHVMARTIKDIFCRYQTLKGKQVKRKGGWDTHGLPIELQVEKELGITKDDIGKKISVEEYNQKCREAVMKFTDQWNELTEMMGYWVDLDDPYITYKNEYIESLWYLLKKLYDKGLLYKGYTIQPYSPAAGTGLSSHELNQPGTYKEVKDVSIVAQFKVKQNQKSQFLFSKTGNEVFILAWTTTPWTLPSNAALTVGKNIDYQLIQTFNPYTFLPLAVVCAKDRVGAYFPEAGKDQPMEYKQGDKILSWKILTDCKGADLEGIEYEQLMPYVTPEEPAFRVILGDFVTTEDGTGVVHTAPTFGADDFRVAQQNGIPPIMVPGEDGKPMPLVNKQGRFVAAVTDFAGEPVKEQYLDDAEKEKWRQKQGRDKYLSVDERIGIKLKTENRAFNVQKFDHPYPHCWRTDKPVLYYPLDSWFIRTTAVKDKMIALNKQINWKPESTGTGRFGNWLENLVDWNLSRSRYWGTPLPIWRTEDGKEEICVGSVGQLVDLVQNSVVSGKLSGEDLLKNKEFLAKIEPHPKSLSKGEGLDIAGRKIPLSSGEGPGVRSGNQEPRTWLKYVATTDSKSWKNLKEFGRENRKNPTKAEDALWQSVRNQKLGFKVRRQHAIAGYIADFVCIPEKLVIEIDGEYHLKPEYKDYEKNRTAFFEEHGFEVIRFSNEEVETNLENVLSSIKNTLERKDVSSSSPLEKGLGDEATFDLHRPFVDHIILVSPSGKPMKRETDLIDVWFDSGAMPYAQWHYPFENKDIFDKSFPADFISEGVDQTRGWFFTLHAIASMLSDEPEFGEKLSPAFKNVVSTGLVLDKDGEKMSKRKGNVINPFEAIRNYGPDPVRWYMITNSNPWDNLRFNLDGVTEVRNKFFGTLANTYNFFALYANIDGFKINENQRFPKEKLTELDCWVLSKLNSLMVEVDGYYADYEPTKAGRAIQDFVCDHLSNWYVRLGRKRFWRGEMTENKQAAYETLQHCLLVVSQLMSPIAPFFAEWLYKSLTDGNRKEAKENDTPLQFESVHLTFLTQAETHWIDPELEAAMDLAQRTSSLVHSLRKNHKLKVRQPLGRMLVPVVSKEFRQNLEKVEDLILSEVNIKNLEYIEDTSGLVEKSAKPNFKKLGKSLGPKLKAFGELVAVLTQAQINQFEKYGLEVELEGEKMFLKDDDLEIRSENIPGWVVANDQEITVALDLTLTDELKMEGIARDVVNRVQNQRKDMGLDVLDRIVIRFAKTNNELVTKALEANKEYICTETQANALEFSEGPTLDQLLELEDFSLAFGIEKS
jgi:isoleucyl-tRNA synthetase